MSGTTRHVEGEGYSSKNMIPRVSDILNLQNKQQDELLSKKNVNNDNKVEGLKSEEDDDKATAMNKAKTAGKKATTADVKIQGEREVLDPITEQKVIIKDAELSDFQDDNKDEESIIKSLDPNNSTPGPSTNSPNTNETSTENNSTRLPAPKIKPGNVLIKNFPPPVDQNSLNTITSNLATYSYAIIGALVGIWFLVAFGNGYYAFFLRSSVIFGLAGGVYASFGIIGRKIEKELERIRLEMGKERGETYSPPVPESVEWMNAFTTTIWPLINPEMFTSVVDMIEDVMQVSLPGFVDAVKIDDFTLGKNALRIVSMRALPDKPQDKEYPRQEWIDQGDKKVRQEEEKKALEEGNQQGESDIDLDQTGDYVNYEISFAYFAPPGTKKVQEANISLILAFFLGVYDWVHIPIPIYIAVESIVGTLRLRLQLVPAAPFVRNVTFTLMGIPHIEASAIPLMKGLPNVLDLPVISGFVQSSIAAAASAYCAPKSMTMNIAKMIGGDGIKKDTKALGILAVTIHYAEGLSAQDDNGFSDPYIVLAFAKFGKPLFSTRIITKDLNPVYEQTAYLIVSDDDVQAKEKLSVQLWDSDKMSADDLIGRIQVSLSDLMLKPGQVSKRNDTLMGFEDSDTLSGTLTWSVAYYDKAKLNSNLKMKEGIDHSLPKELQDRPEMKVETKTVDTDEETDVRRTPPDPKWPAGVLSIIIHQINNLECQNLAESTASGKNREGQAGQDTDNQSEATGKLPSAYVEILVNDDMIYKTRVKQYSTNPYFEAGTEVFLRDWTQTRLNVVVRDARLRELDPILGIINLDLEEIFANSSQVTRLFAIQDGVGFGRVNISVLFKAVEINLPRELKGWDTGTVCVTSNVRVEPVEGTTFDFREKKLTISTQEAKQKLPGSLANPNGNGIEWTVDSHIRLPTYDRYSSALYFNYGGSALTLGPLGNKLEAFAVLWLQELVDDEPKEIRIPVIIGKDMNTLRQNFINDQTMKTHNYEIVGYLIATVELDSGLDEDHEEYAETQTARHEMEAYNRVIGQAAEAEVNSHANDDGVIDQDEKRAIAKSHKKALEARGRGMNQVKIVRTARWSRQGIKDRVRGLKEKITGSTKEETVASEA